MDWTQFREQFPVTAQWAYFDHAAVCPLPTSTRDTIIAWADDVTSHGVVHEGHWIRRLEDIRLRFGELLHADPLDIAFIKNTSEGICLIAEGLRWQPGDNVVTLADEYPSNLYPWMNLADRGVECRIVPTHEGRVNLDDLAGAIDSKTRLVTVSFVEFATGFRNDLDAIGQLCRERKVLFFVDAIQGLGVFPLDVSRTPIDFLAADGHKWLLGPEGAGILWIRRECLDHLRPISVGWHSVVGAMEFSKIDLRLKPHAGRYENGTFNLGGVLGLGASLDLLLAAGIDKISHRLLELTDHLCQTVEKTGWTVYSSRQPRERSGIVSLTAPSGKNPDSIVQECRRQGIVVNQRAGRLRVSPHAYNTTSEIDKLVSLLGELP